jgi:hypothetical protein
MRKITARRCMAAVAVVLMSTLVAACASGGSSGGGAGTGAGAGQRGVSKSAITIAGDATLTSGGVPNAINNAIEIGAKARYWLANQQGGVHGRQIDFLGVADDGGSAATLVGNVSKQVLQQTRRPLLSPS